VCPANGSKVYESKLAKAPEGNSSIGRASVSKTEGWGFKSLLPCRGEVKADHSTEGHSVADKEEVEPEASSAELSGANPTSAELKSSPTGMNGSEAKEDTSNDSQSGKVLEPAGVAAATSSASAKTAGTRRPTRAPKGAPTNKRDQRVKRERTTPIKFVRQSLGELRKVVYPTGPQLINYFVVVLVFVLFVIAYVSLLDLGFGWVIFKIFS
jgi:preprotein translocase subunit SecE